MPRSVDERQSEIEECLARLDRLREYAAEISRRSPGIEDDELARAVHDALKNLQATVGTLAIELLDAKHPTKAGPLTLIGNQDGIERQIRFFEHSRAACAVSLLRVATIKDANLRESMQKLAAEQIAMYDKIIASRRGDVPHGAACHQISSCD